jgi:nucleoside-diphosphate-sugar epimerase
MPRTLITGATGFVGANLAEHLHRLGWEVRCLVRDPARANHLRQLGLELAPGQLDDSDSLRRAVQNVDVVFHAAGRVHALGEEQFTADNVAGTRGVAQACAAATQPPTMIFISSLAAAGPSVLGQPRREGDIDQPISAYGRSKLAAERAAADLAGVVPLSIIRPPIIFGPRDRSSLSLFRSVYLSRLHAVPGRRKFPVSLVHVSDLCDALVRIAERGVRVTPSDNGQPDIAPASYYVAAERTVMYGDLGRLVAQAVGRRVAVTPVPKFVFWMVGGMVEVLGRLRGRPGLLNLDKIREAMAPGWECSDEKLRRELGYLPGAKLEDRFVETARWYRENGWL